MRHPDGAPGFRLAGPRDAAAVARLHAESWRAHYRGSLSDSYLDGPIEAERLAAWTGRLAEPSAEQVVVLCEEADTLLGFVCAFIDEESRWGTLVDNLHIRRDRKGAGLGRALMRDLARRLIRLGNRSPVHLFVLESNAAAQAFYRRVGGNVAGGERHSLPDGSEAPVLRIAWASPDALFEAAGA